MTVEPDAAAVAGRDDRVGSAGLGAVIDVAAARAVARARLQTKSAQWAADAVTGTADPLAPGAAAAGALVLIPLKPPTERQMLADESAAEAWAREWAALAPMVFDHADLGDPVAVSVVAAAEADIEALIGRLTAEGIGRIALMGGLAPSYRRRLSSRFAGLLVEPAGDALDGALGLARRDASL